MRLWAAREIALLMLNNLVTAYKRRGDLGAAIRAADMRIALPAEEPLRAAQRAELLAPRARLN